MLKPFDKFLGISALFTLQIGIFALTFNSASAIAEDRFEVCAGDLIDLDAQLPPEKKLTPERISAACADALHPEELSVCVLSIVKNTSPEILAEDALKSCYRVRRPIELARCVVRINKQIVARQIKSQETEVEDREIEETEEMEMPIETPPQTPETPETPPQTPPQDKEIELEKQTDKPVEMPIQIQTPTQPPIETQIAPTPIDPNLIVLALDNCRSSLSPLRFADCTLGLYGEIPDYPVQLAMTTCLSAEDNPSRLLPVSNESR